MKNVAAAFVVLSILSCSSVSSGVETRSMNLHLGETSYAELVDFLYGYAGEHRLNVMWFGWYRVDNAQHWYERSDRDSNFKVKLALLGEDNGYIFLSNHFDESIAGVAINYGDEKAIWLEKVEGFLNAVEENGWRLEELDN